MQVNLIHSTLVFREKKNIVHVTVLVNLIHSKLVFFLNVQKINTLKKTTVHANSTSELLALFA